MATLKEKILNSPSFLEHLVSSDMVELNSVKGEYDPSIDFRKKVLEKGYTIVALFARYYQGWECDEWSCEAVDIMGSQFFIATDHGHLVIERD